MVFFISTWDGLKKLSERHVKIQFQIRYHQSSQIFIILPANWLTVLTGLFSILADYHLEVSLGLRVIIYDAKSDLTSPGYKTWSQIQLIVIKNYWYTVYITVVLAHNINEETYPCAQTVLLWRGWNINQACTDQPGHASEQHWPGMSSASLDTKPDKKNSQIQILILLTGSYIFRVIWLRRISWKIAT